MIRKVQDVHVVGSRDLSDELDIEHKNLLAIIRKSIARGEDLTGAYRPSSYKDSQRRMIFQFDITEEGLNHFSKIYQPALLPIRKLFEDAKVPKGVPSSSTDLLNLPIARANVLAPSTWVTSKKLLSAYPVLFVHAKDIVQTWPAGCKQSAVLTMAMKRLKIQHRVVSGVKFKVTEFYMRDVLTWIERLTSPSTLDILQNTEYNSLVGK